jgi:D-alanine-D-alanine ligase
MKKKTIALIFGGISSEREVSLNSGKQVYDALDKNKYDILIYDPKTDIPRLVADAGQNRLCPDHPARPYGEDGTVQGLLDLLDIPYQGAGVLGSCSRHEQTAVQASIRTGRADRAAVCAGPAGEPVDVDRIVDRLGLPLVVKPVETGSSVGMSIVRDRIIPGRCGGKGVGPSVPRP